jgi:mannose-6-phosphate isomerase-like protein (cupin superfamily)
MNKADTPRGYNEQNTSNSQNYGDKGAQPPGEKTMPLTPPENKNRPYQNSGGSCAKPPREDGGVSGVDMGNSPTILNVEKSAKANPFYRNTLWTGEHSQITVMSIPTGEEIGIEKHDENDQFIKIEDGFGEVYFGRSPEELSLVGRINDEFAVIVPAGIYHNIKNIGNKPLKLYSVYSPSHHPYGTLHKTKSDEE